MEYLEYMEYAHKYHKLPLWIRNFKASVLNVSSKLSHIQEALALPIANEESNSESSNIDMKLVLENATMFSVLGKA